MKELIERLEKPAPEAPMDKDGGAAFPRPQSSAGLGFGHGIDPGASGMSLRDYFAAHIAAGMCSNDGVLLMLAKDKDGVPFAKQIYAIADAMIEARKTKELSHG